MTEDSLMDFLDEEVVDKDGVPVGTLACFWESASQRPAYLGIKISTDPVVRVVPVRMAIRDEYNSCIQLGYSARQVEGAPGWDCSMDLDAVLQEKVHEHFGGEGKEIHPALKHHARGANGTDACSEKPSQ